MDSDTQSVYDETVISWLENAIEHARPRSGQGFVVLGTRWNELTEMRHETELATRP